MINEFHPISGIGADELEFEIPAKINKLFYSSVQGA